MRHIPGAKACSLCVFPPDEKFAPTSCATYGPATPQTTVEQEHTDAALPFLSFAAELMIAAEALKLTAPGYALSTERVMLGLRSQALLVGSPIPHRASCLCEARQPPIGRAGALDCEMSRLQCGCNSLRPDIRQRRRSITY